MIYSTLILNLIIFYYFHIHLYNIQFIKQMALVESEAIVTQDEIEWTEGQQKKFGLAKVTTRLYPCREQVLKRK